MLSTINIKRTPVKFQEITNLDSELDAILKQINLGFENIVNSINGSIHWLSGTGVPKQSLGSNGDFYLDETTKNIYKKVNGSWL